MRCMTVGVVVFALWGLVPPAGADTVVEFAAPLQGINPSEELVFRVVDVKGTDSGPHAHVRVFCYAADGGSVGTTSGELLPAQAFTFRLPYAALGSTHPFPAVRASIQLSLPGDGLQNHVLLTYEFFDVQSHHARPGGSCVPVKLGLAPPPEGGREFKCIGPSVEPLPSQ